MCAHLHESWKLFLTYFRSWIRLVNSRQSRALPNWAIKKIAAIKLNYRPFPDHSRCNQERSRLVRTKPSTHLHVHTRGIARYAHLNITSLLSHIKKRKSSTQFVSFKCIDVRHSESKPGQPASDIFGPLGNFQKIEDTNDTKIKDSRSPGKYNSPSRARTDGQLQIYWHLFNCLSGKGPSFTYIFVWHDPHKWGTYMNITDVKIQRLNKNENSKNRQKIYSGMSGQELRPRCQKLPSCKVWGQSPQ